MTESYWQIRGTDIGDVILTVSPKDNRLNPQIILEFGKTGGQTVINRVAYEGEVGLVREPSIPDGWVVNYHRIRRVHQNGQGPTQAAIDFIESASVTVVEDWALTQEGQRALAQ